MTFIDGLAIGAFAVASGGWALSIALERRIRECASTGEVFKFFGVEYELVPLGHRAVLRKSNTELKGDVARLRLELRDTQAKLARSRSIERNLVSKLRRMGVDA